MEDLKSWNGVEACLLKECYDLASQFERLDTARYILREKSKRIETEKSYIPTLSDASYRESEMHVLSEIVYGLTLDGVTDSESSATQYMHKLSSLPNSAEKEYVLALLALRDGTSVTQRLDALRHISAALNSSPNDPRYIALARVLQDAD